MLGINHVVTACSGWQLLSATMLNRQPEPVELALQLIVVSLGALLPDVDHPDSMMGRRLKIISVPLSYLQGDRSFVPWSEQTHSRGITHSIWALAACYWLLSGQSAIAMALAFGFVAHLIGDAMTPSGVRLFWPLAVTVRSPVTFKTGGLVEYLVTIVFATAAVLQWLGVDVLQEIKGFLAVLI